LDTIIPTAKCFTVLIIAEAHKKYGGMGTLLVNKVNNTILKPCILIWSLSCYNSLFLILYANTFNQVSAESANQFGELVADPETNELLHYTEKPETFVSAVLLSIV
jgi:mannose-1-phosphate guanylyltransferase